MEFCVIYKRDVCTYSDKYDPRNDTYETLTIAIEFENEAALREWIIKNQGIGYGKITKYKIYQTKEIFASVSVDIDFS